MIKLKNKYSAVAIVMVSSLLISGCTDKPNSANNNIEKTRDTSTKISAPIAKKTPYVMTQHGDERIDNYYWMRDDSRKNADILAHLNAENSYVEQELAHTQSLQDTLFDEMTGRLKKDDASVPYLHQGYWWYTKFEGEQEYPIYFRKKDEEHAKEEVLIDVNILAKDQAYFNLRGTNISTNNNILAYATDNVSRRLYTIEFKDLTNGKNLSDKLVNTTGQAVWANDNKTVFYIKKDLQTLLGYQVYRHELGTAQDEDVLVYEEKDTSFYTWLGKTIDNSTIYIYHNSTNKKGASIVSADQPKQSFTPFTPLEDNVEYSFDRIGDWFYIRTNFQAKNFRLMKVQADNTQDMSLWQEVLPYDEKAYLEDYVLLQDHMIIKQKIMGVSEINVMDLSSGNMHAIKFDDPAYQVYFTTNINKDAKQVRLVYSSMTTPRAVREYDLKNYSYQTLKQDEVVGEFDSSWYKSERIFVEARDGKIIPVSIVYRKDKFKKDGRNPIYQYAYGSYGSTIEPSFSVSRLSLLDRGFVYVIAHIRGGQMLGREWYENGKMLNKKNTFTDFIDVTKALPKLNYGDANKIFAAGGSAGGLLMGAIVNMAPELYKGIGAHVPFVDVVTTMSDPSIPLTTNEYDEWGNPANIDEYKYMLSYSPYDQVTAQEYPNMLVTTGLHDSQVQYFEPMKWVAKLREMKTDSNKLYFKTNMEAGHGGASGRFKRFKKRALEYAFFLDIAGITQ